MFAIKHKRARDNIPPSPVTVYPEMSPVKQLKIPAVGDCPHGLHLSSEDCDEHDCDGELCRELYACTTPQDNRSHLTTTRRHQLQPTVTRRNLSASYDEEPIDYEFEIDTIL